MVMVASGSIEAWRQWREACALGRTPPEARVALTRFLAARFHRLVRRGGLGTPPDDSTCAHLFESWCALHARADGKRYKDWLLTRGDASLGAVESGVSLLMRKVVLEWGRSERDRIPSVSLETPLSGSDPGFTLSDLLPGTMEDPRFEENEWTERVRPRIREEMSHSQKVAAAARAAGLRFSDSRVRALAGVEKSTIYNHYREWVLHVGRRVRETFPHHAPEQGLQLTLHLLEAVSQDLLSEFFPEKMVSRGCGEKRNSP